MGSSSTCYILVAKLHLFIPRFYVVPFVIVKFSKEGPVHHRSSERVFSFFFWHKCKVLGGNVSKCLNVAAKSRC